MMKKNNMMVEVDFNDYAKGQTKFTKTELLSIIRQIRIDADVVRQQIVAV